MTVAVTGGTGFVGHAFLDAAGDAQLTTRALARTRQGGRIGTTWVEGALADHDAMVHLLEGARAIVHIAGVTTAHDAAEFARGNIEGTLSVINAAREAGVSRLIHVSSLAAREPGLSQYGASKAEAERLVEQSGLDWTIVRPPAVYGPRDRDMLELFRLARWRFLPVPSGARTSIIHVHDLARLLLILAQDCTTEMHQKVLEPDDGRKGGWDHSELAQAIGAAVGCRPLVLGQSASTLRWLARLDRMLRGDKAKLTADRASYLAHHDWVISESKRVPKDLWRPRIKTPAGLNMTAKWYRGEGWL